MLSAAKTALLDSFSRVSSFFAGNKRRRQESELDLTKHSNSAKKSRTTNVLEPKMEKTEPTKNANRKTQNSNSHVEERDKPSSLENERRPSVITKQPVSVSATALPENGNEPTKRTEKRPSLRLPCLPEWQTRLRGPSYCLTYYNDYATQTPTWQIKFEEKDKFAGNSNTRVRQTSVLNERRESSSAREPRLRVSSSGTPKSTRDSAINICEREKGRDAYTRLLEESACKPIPRNRSISVVRVQDATFNKSLPEVKPSQQREELPVTPKVTLRSKPESPAADAFQNTSLGLSLAAASPQFNPEYVPSIRNRFNCERRDLKKKIEEEKRQVEQAKTKREELEKTLIDSISKQLSLIEVIPEVKLPPITEEMELVISRVLRQVPATSIVCRSFENEITVNDLKSLTGLNWLNDQIINTYFSMIAERSKSDTTSYPKCYAFNTFFYPKLQSSGHSSLKRWTRKVDIFSYDFLLVPVHLGMHWCAAVISIKEKCINYYDSLGGKNQKCLEALLQYLFDESLDKKKVALDKDQWKTACVSGIPKQNNGSDCGVFACKFAEYVSRNAKFTFSQKDMPYFRRRMIYEIVSQILVHP